MRTTLSLEPDVERLVKDAMHAQDASMKDVVNRALRQALRGGAPVPVKKFVQRTVDCGPLLMSSEINFNRLADELEDQEIIAKLARGA
jgi:hypothetical protein